MSDCDKRDGEPLAVLAQWYRTPLGRRLAEAESICLERMLEDSFGHYLLQVGLPDRFADAVRVSRIRHHLRVNPVAFHAGENGARMQANPGSLPILSDSVDAVLLPHTLDFSTDVHAVLREAERVLIPEGRLLIFGFNPLSTWGLWRTLPRRRRRVPWCGEMLTLFRVCDWLKLIGFQIEIRDTLMFRAPSRRAYGARLDWLDRLCGRWCPALGGVYAIRAVKRVSTPTPLRPSWTSRPVMLPGRTVEPTAREGRHA